jgi:hypothetical protein
LGSIAGSARAAPVDDAAAEAPSYFYHGTEGACVGWAQPEYGEVDLWIAPGELRLIWSPPILSFVSAPVPTAHSTAASISLGETRAGMTSYVGAWFVQMKEPSPFGGGGKGFQYAFWYNLDVSKVQPVQRHGLDPCVCRCRTQWRLLGLTYQYDLLVYRDMSGVIFARELVVEADARYVLALMPFTIMLP